MIFNTLKFTLNKGIGVLNLNRPDYGNAMNLEMTEELLKIAKFCLNEESLRVLLISSESEKFCVGGDLTEMVEKKEGKSAHIASMANNLHNALLDFSNIPAPIIIAINGVAAGGGFSLVLTGDYVIASEKAKFISAYTASGLTPDGSCTYHLAKHVGLLRAKEIILMNKLLNSKQAFEWGIVTEVIDSNEIKKRSTELANHFSNGPTQTFGAVKKLLNSSHTNSYKDQLALEAFTISNIVNTYDATHGLESFHAKQKPKFIGK